jgi:predicted DNA-binding transcriptional regulator AlpA
MDNPNPSTQQTHESPWLTAEQAAARAQVGVKLIYREAQPGGRLRAARIGGRRELRFLASWIDQWLEASSTPVEVRR